MKILEYLSLNHLLWNCLATLAIIKLMIELKRSEYLNRNSRSNSSNKIREYLKKKFRDKSILKSN